MQITKPTFKTLRVRITEDMWKELLILKRKLEKENNCEVSMSQIVRAGIELVIKENK